MVDDGSTDGTVEKTLEAFERKFSVFSKIQRSKSHIKNSAPAECWAQCGVESGAACANKLKIKLQSKRNNISIFLRV